MRTIFVLTCFLAFAFVGCNNDPCEGVVCQNNGVAVESGDDCFCDCTSFFAGERCNIPINEHYTGTYDGTTECDGILVGQTSYLLTKESGSNNLMNVSNFGFIEFSNRNTFSVPTQGFDGTTSSYTVSGNGTLENNVLTINFTLFAQGTQTQQHNCKFVGSRPY